LFYLADIYRTISICMTEAWPYKFLYTDITLDITLYTDITLDITLYTDITLDITLYG